MSSSDAADYRSLGEVLRDTREAKAWSLEFVAEKTRISVRMLEALEVDDLEKVSGIVYAKGFVKTLAGLYDLDVEFLYAKLDALARELGTATPVAPVDFPTETHASTPSASEKPAAEPKPTKPVWEVETTRVHKVEAKTPLPVSPRWIVLGLAVVVVVLVAVVGARSGWFSREPAAIPASQVDGGADGEESEPGSDATHEAVSNDLRSETEGEVAAESTEGEPTTTSADERTPEEENSPAVPREPEDEDPVGTTQTSSTVADDGRGLPSIVRPAVDGHARRTLLRLGAQDAVEVTVRVDGGAARQRTLAPGETWELVGSDHFLIRASDPAALQVDVGGVRQVPPKNWSGRAEWYLPAVDDEPR